MNHIRHKDGARDRRYTIQREYTGKATPQWVARFCDKWLGSSPTQMGALAVARDHQEGRMAALEGLAS